MANMLMIALLLAVSPVSAVTMPLQQTCDSATALCGTGFDDIQLLQSGRVKADSESAHMPLLAQLSDGGGRGTDVPHYAQVANCQRLDPLPAPWEYYKPANSYNDFKGYEYRKGTTAEWYCGDKFEKKVGREYTGGTAQVCGMWDSDYMSSMQGTVGFAGKCKYQCLDDMCMHKALGAPFPPVNARRFFKPCERSGEVSKDQCFTLLGREIWEVFDAPNMPTLPYGCQEYEHPKSGPYDFFAGPRIIFNTANSDKDFENPAGFANKKYCNKYAEGYPLCLKSSSRRICLSDSALAAAAMF